MNTVDKGDLLGMVREEVSSGYHIKHYSKQGHMWNEDLEQHKHFQELIQLTIWAYINNLRMCTEGREKLSHLQLEWTRLIHSFTHEQELAANSEQLQHRWQALVGTCAQSQGHSTDEYNAIFSSVCRAVFNYCQCVQRH